MDTVKIRSGECGAFGEAIETSLVRSPSPNPVYVNGQLETHHPCSCPFFGPLDLIATKPPPRLHLRPSRRHRGGRSVSSSPSVSVVPSGESEDSESHPPDDPSPIPTHLGNQGNGQREDAEPHHPPALGFPLPTLEGILGEASEDLVPRPPPTLLSPILSPLVAGQREVAEPHRPSDQDLLSQSGEQRGASVLHLSPDLSYLFGEPESCEDVEPHPPSTLFSPIPSIPQVGDQREGFEPHLDIDLDFLSFLSPRASDDKGREDHEPHDLSDLDPLLSLPVGLPAARESEGSYSHPRATDHTFNPEANRLFLPSIPDPSDDQILSEFLILGPNAHRAEPELIELDSSPASTVLRSPRSPEVIILESTPEPVAPVTQSVPKKRKTRRAGRKNQLRRLIKLVKTSQSKGSRAGDLPALHRTIPRQQGCDRPKPRVISIEKIHLAIRPRRVYGGTPRWDFAD